MQVTVQTLKRTTMLVQPLTTRNRPGLLKPEDYYLLLLSQVESQEAATGKSQDIKRLYVPWNDVEGIRSTGSVLFDYPSWTPRPGLWVATLPTARTFCTG